MAFTFDDMLKFADEAWGQTGTSAVRKWALYNKRYFGGVLRPIPLVITNAQPFGKRLAFCSSAHGQSRTITVNVPSTRHQRLLADNNTLLHEMVHQFLVERGNPPGHDGLAWRREIMRLHKTIHQRRDLGGPLKDSAPGRQGCPHQRASSGWPRVIEARGNCAVATQRGHPARRARRFLRSGAPAFSLVRLAAYHFVTLRRLQNQALPQGCLFRNMSLVTKMGASMGRPSILQGRDDRRRAHAPLPCAVGSEQAGAAACG